VIFQLLGLAWDQVGRARGVRRPLLFLWGRMVRDAAANCLPFSQVGGFVFEARAVVLHGLSWPVATATTIVDLTTEFLAELAFIGLGLSILLTRAPKTDIAVPVEAGLGLLILAAVVFLWLQRGAAPLFVRLAERIAGHAVEGARLRLAGLHAEMMALYGHTGRLLASVMLHLLAWLASGLADWIVSRSWVCGLMWAPRSQSRHCCRGLLPRPSWCRGTPAFRRRATPGWARCSGCRPRCRLRCR
jgi:hypothetical protein